MGRSRRLFWADQGYSLPAVPTVILGLRNPDGTWTMRNQGRRTTPRPSGSPDVGSPRCCATVRPSGSYVCWRSRGNGGLLRWRGRCAREAGAKFCNEKAKSGIRAEQYRKFSGRNASYLRTASCRVQNKSVKVPTARTCFPRFSPKPRRPPADRDGRWAKNGRSGWLRTFTPKASWTCLRTVVQGNSTTARQLRILSKSVRFAAPDHLWRRWFCCDG